MLTALQPRVRWPKSILYPLDRLFTVSVGVDRDNVEANRAVRIRGTSGQEQSCCANDLLLLVTIDCQAGAREAVSGPITNFYEHEAVAVAHDQVDFAETTAVILCDLSQAVLLQEAQC